jgi:glycosyltransferase involved in cell wall biosynthesis
LTAEPDSRVGAFDPDSRGLRCVYLEGRIAGWDLHSLYREITDYPPEGYRFLLPKGSFIKQSRFYPINRGIVSFSATKFLYDCVRPKAYYFALSALSRKKIEADLVYASQHVVNYSQPWVVDLEHAGALAAYGRTELIRKMVEKTFRSPWCRKIMPWTQMAKKSLEASFDCRGLQDKIEVVNLAVRPKNFKKEYHERDIRIIFVGTANQSNIQDSFDIKGGREMLEAFRILKRTYSNLELVIRSYVPDWARDVCARLNGVRLIDNLITPEELSTEFKSADVFVFPGHSTPGMVILEAMSYELPVVATDVWANRELVDDGRTGFLIKGSSKVRYFDENFIPLWGEPRFMRAIRRTDLGMIEELVEKTSILIEDEKLRRRMGKAGRLEIEKGKFSIITRNEKIKKIFDEAIESS